MRLISLVMRKITDATSFGAAGSVRSLGCLAPVCPVASGSFPARHRWLTKRLIQ
jgi:hypothetical protein